MVKQSKKRDTGTAGFKLDADIRENKISMLLTKHDHGTYSSFELNSSGARTSSVERGGIAATPFGEEVGVAHAEEVKWRR